MTSKLRAKLDALPPRLAGQSLELSHSVLDFDLIEEENILFKILQEHNPDIDYLLGKFYNGIKRPASDGLFLSDPDSPAHLISAGEIYESSVNSIFGGDATRVCISLLIHMHLHLFAMFWIKFLQSHPYNRLSLDFAYLIAHQLCPILISQKL